MSAFGTENNGYRHNSAIRGRYAAIKQGGATDLLNFLYTEVNIVGAMVLLLMLANRKKSCCFKNLPVDQQIFNGVVLLNLLIFMFDTGMWLVDGTSIPGLKAVNYIVTTLYYLFNPLICFLWLLYTDFKIHESRSPCLQP